MAKSSCIVEIAPGLFYRHNRAVPKAGAACLQEGYKAQGDETKIQQDSNPYGDMFTLEWLHFSTGLVVRAKETLGALVRQEKDGKTFLVKPRDRK